MDAKTYLFQLTIPSVQKLILSSRKAQDLWAGSFIVSNLLKETVKDLKNKSNISFIFPHEDLLGETEGKISNVPNKILFTVEGSKEEIKKIGQDLEKSIKEKLKNLINTDFINEKLSKMKCGSKELMKYQLENFVNVIWGAVPLKKDNYIASLDNLDNYISYKKSSILPNRRFIESYKVIDFEKEEYPFVEGLGFEQIYDYFTDSKIKKPHIVKGAYRCTLCGDRIILEADGKDYKGNSFWENVWKENEKIFTEGERLCGVCLVKRTYKSGGFPSVSEIATTTFKLFLKNYPETVKEIANIIKSADNGKKYFSKNPQSVPKLQGESNLNELLKIDGEYLIPQVRENDEEKPEIAVKLKNVYKELNKAPSDSFAVLIMDGDSMGAKLRLINDIDKQKELSKKLSNFTKEVKKIVEDENYGKLIYAGGDDVLALLPIEFALKCAYEIQKAFSKELKEIEELIQRKLQQEKKDKTEYKFTMSGGLLFAYHKLPLNYVLNKVREFEQKAKNSGKNRIYFGYLKHSLSYSESFLLWDEYEVFEEILKTCDEIPNTFITQSYRLFKELENSNNDMNEKLFKYLLKKKVKEDKVRNIVETINKLNSKFNDPLRVVNILKIAKYINKQKVM